jgi:hypothetical protein
VLASDPAQATGAVVQIAHRGHEGDALEVPENLGELGGSVNDLHGLPQPLPRFSSSARRRKGPIFTAATNAAMAPSMLSCPFMKLRTNVAQAWP